MQISFLIANLGIRGSVRRVVMLSNKLIERGHNVTIYTSDGLPCQWLPCQAATKSAEEITTDLHDLIIYFGDYASLVKKASTYLKAYYVLGINEKDETGVAAWLRSTGTTASKRSVAFRHAMQDKGHLILANCSASADWLKQFRDDVYPVFGGVDFDTFYPHGSKVPFRVLTGGSNREIEGTGIVKQAVEIAREKEPRIELKTYAGMGYSQKELAALYSSADVYMDAQTRGGWNNPVAEAMACKTAVVCTNIFGNRDFAHHLETAYVADDNPEALAAGLLEVLSNGDLRRRLVLNAYETIRAFTWDKATDQLEAAINDRL